MKFMYTAAIAVLAYIGSSHATPVPPQITGPDIARPPPPLAPTPPPPRILILGDLDGPESDLKCPKTMRTALNQASYLAAGANDALAKPGAQLFEGVLRTLGKLTAEELKTERSLRLEGLSEYIRGQATHKSLLVSRNDIKDVSGPAVVFTCPSETAQKTLTESSNPCQTTTKRAVKGKEETPWGRAQIREIIFCPIFIVEKELDPGELRRRLFMAFYSKKSENNFRIVDSGYTVLARVLETLTMPPTPSNPRPSVLQSLTADTVQDVVKQPNHMNSEAWSLAGLLSMELPGLFSIPMFRLDPPTMVPRALDLATRKDIVVAQVDMLE